jgi:hypothetical protein
MVNRAPGVCVPGLRLPGVLLLVLLHACDGRAPSAPPPRTPVAQLELSAATTTLAVGTRLTLTAVPRDANGIALVARTITWRADDARVVTVSDRGLVDALAPGTTRIRAESEGRTAIVPITVVPADSCTAPTVALPPRGEAVTLPVGERVCLGFGTEEATSHDHEFALVAFSPAPNEGAQTTFSIRADRIAQVAAPTQSMARVPRVTALTPQRLHHDAFHGPPSDVLGDGATVMNGDAVRGAAEATVTLPREGDVVSLKLRGFGGCAPQPDALARVVSVLEHSIVYADIENPAGGFSDEELRAFAAQFDTLSAPLALRTFGALLDADRNGRVAIVFTHKAGDAVGFVATRDWRSIGECPNSNAGEYLYLSVPEPASESPFTSRAFLARVLPSVLIHEYTHLISLSATGRMKSPWLEEGVAHIAEELLYRARTAQGAGVRQTRALIEADATRREAFASFQPTVENLAEYLAASTMSSPFGAVPTATTRGAAWSLLRFASDRRGGDESARWRALLAGAGVNAQLGDQLAVSRDWVLSHAFAHWGDPSRTAARFATPGWDMRSVLETVPNAALAWSPLPEDTTQFTLGGLGAQYFRFGLRSDRLAVLETRVEGETPGALELHLLRVR